MLNVAAFQIVLFSNVQNSKIYFIKFQMQGNQSSLFDRTKGLLSRLDNNLFSGMTRQRPTISRVQSLEIMSLAHKHNAMAKSHCDNSASMV